MLLLLHIYLFIYLLIQVSNGLLIMDTLDRSVPVQVSTVSPCILLRLGLWVLLEGGAFLFDIQVRSLSPSVYVIIMPTCISSMYELFVLPALPLNLVIYLCMKLYFTLSVSVSVYLCLSLCSYLYLSMSKYSSAYRSLYLSLLPHIPFSRPFLPSFSLIW